MWIFVQINESKNWYRSLLNSLSTHRCLWIHTFVREDKHTHSKVVLNWDLGLRTFGTEEVQKHSIIQNSLRSKISKHNFLNSWVTSLYIKLCFFSSSPLRISELMNDEKSSKENGVWIYEISSDGITKLLRPLWVNTEYFSIWCIS